MILNDKYFLSLTKSINFVENNLVEFIYDSSRLEGLNVTLEQVQAVVVDEMAPDGLNLKEVLVINNLKRAWSFLMEYLDYYTYYPFI